jgi:exosortase A-associated hydrolase 1
MNFEERALSLLCDGSWMYGILSLPEQAASRGVLIVVGGPQYRVGSHRQFTLLARHLASLGIPVLRFDYRGMGDSEGALRTFEDLEDDLHCAIERFFEEVPALNDLVIWGLCDAASAALFHAHRDRRITGLVLLNPWVRTDQGAAKAYLKHYYLTRLLDPEFWSKVWSGRFNYANATQSLVKTVEKALPGRKIAVTRDQTGDRSCDFASLPERMLDGLSRYKGKILLITSGDDLTAQEFLELVKGSGEWQRLLAAPGVSRLNLPEANHTFSRRAWRDEVAVGTSDWIQSW